MTLSHRPEIDGLRAVAVVPVLLFHAGLTAFAGGFVGVDVFFVISGYLITSIIAADLDEGRFSFLKFYERRARRILPALFLVMAVSIPFAWIWLMPAEMAAFSQSVISVCVFLSNVLFWQQTTYFDAGASLKPLLHTWSLAVEEQFYIFFPIGLILLWRLGRRMVIGAILLVALLSLGLSEYAWRYHNSANFYLLPTRAWELMVGALCAFAALRPHLRRDNIIGAAGLAAIVLSIVLYDGTTPFPSVYALLPVLGTAAVILCARHGTWVARLLSLRPIVGIGLISYSAYLWHYPLMAFAHVRAVPEPSPGLMLALAGLSLILAWPTWRFVEAPARRRGAWPLPDRRAVFGAAALLGAAFVAFGLAGTLTGGLPFRLPPDIRVLDQRTADNLGLSTDCDGDFRLAPACRTSDSPEILLWGDSYAMHLLDGLRASKPDLKIIQLTHAVCGPFLGIAPTSPRFSAKWARGCMAFNDQVLDYAAHTPSIRYAVLSSPLSQFVDDGSMVMTREGQVVPGADVALAAFRDTLDGLDRLGITPVIFAPPPISGFDVGNCLIRSTLLGLGPQTCDFSLDGARARQQKVRAFVEDIAKERHVIWFDTAICPDGICRAAQDGVFLFRDYGHLSHEGSAWLGARMDFYALVTGAAAP